MIELATHPCALPGCDHQIHQAHRFFCWPHWRLIPTPLKQTLARVQLRRVLAGGAALPLDQRTKRLLDEACAAIRRVPAPEHTPT